MIMDSVKHWFDDCGEDTVSRNAYDNSFVNDGIIEQSENIDYSEYGISVGTQQRCNAYEEVSDKDFFNRKNALEDNIPFIVESRLAAMSLEELGYPALAIEDFNKTDHLINKIGSMKNKSDKCFVLMLTDSVEGLRQQKKIADKFNNEDISFVEAKCYSGDEDLSINERLLNDRNELNKTVSLLKNSADRKKRNSKKGSFVYGSDMEDYFRNIKPESDKKVLTGFKDFDTVTGGFGAGIHILGGISSAGKTSLFVQLADEFAKQGKYVLFFNLEMFNRDLVAKSYSRFMYLQNGLKTTKTDFEDRLIAKEYSDLYDSSKRSTFTSEENDAFEKAMTAYSKTCGKKICFYDRNSTFRGKTIKVDEMKYIADNFAEKHSDDFVIFCDYLQVLAERYNSTDERQMINRCVSGLKDIAHLYKIPLFLISAINRGGYKEQFDMQAFKSSGSIEYTADSLLGLQLDGMDFIDSDVNESKRKARLYGLEQRANEAKKDPKKDVDLQLKVLKFRNKRPFDISLKAKLAFGYFENPQESGNSDKGEKKAKKTAVKSTGKTSNAGKANTNNIAVEDDPFTF